MRALDFALLLVSAFVCGCLVTWHLLYKTRRDIERLIASGPSESQEIT